ncbi:MAG: nitrogenase molybdenum-iron protein subunit beta [Verrucomicrobiales bacterium]|nr:nitrogenase molybdenum-iron protein subunit beta [Verrucomicrobiales bacterium]
MLDGTTATIKPREALRINPAKTCQPIGAMYAALGLHGCMPHSHGSQGCCAYHRSHLTRHFKEPVVATSSSFTEGASVFGGLANMTQALNNIFTIYNPEVVAVHTTCLSEVIGDDIPMMIKKATEEGIIPNGKVVIHANTPSFVGSHVTGFANMVTAMVKYLSESTGLTQTQKEANRRLNIIPGFIDPSDMRELKRIAEGMGVGFILFPDTSGVLDLPQDGHYRMFPGGGATVEQIKAAGDSLATLALGHFTSRPAAEELDEKCGVPAALLDLPIGLTNTDRFIHALRNYGGVDVPATLGEERGRLLDAMSDLHQYFHGKRVAVSGDPDHVIALTQFLVDLDMQPAFVITGSMGNHFETRIREILAEQVPDAVVEQNTDLFALHQWIKNKPVDVIIGNTYSKYISRVENIPFVRFGFPTLDRMGHRYFPSVGYMGALRLMEKINDALLDKHERECADEYFELVH